MQSCERTHIRTCQNFKKYEHTTIHPTILFVQGHMDTSDTGEWCVCVFRHTRNAYTQPFCLCRATDTSDTRFVSYIYAQHTKDTYEHMNESWHIPHKIRVRGLTYVCVRVYIRVSEDSHTCESFSYDSRFASEDSHTYMQKWKNTWKWLTYIHDIHAKTANDTITQEVHTPNHFVSAGLPTHLTQKFSQRMAWCRFFFFFRVLLVQGLRRIWNRRISKRMAWNQRIRVLFFFFHYF